MKTPALLDARPGRPRGGPEGQRRRGQGAPSAPAPPDPERRVRASRRPDRRVLLASLVITVALHVLALWLYPVLMRRLAPGVADGPPEASVRPDGIETVVILEVADVAEPPSEEAPQVEEPPVRATPVRPAPRGPPGEPADAEERPGLSAAERLRPRGGDARVLRPVDPALLELSPEERARLALEGRLEAWNDSVAAERARAAAALDWTHTDGDGNRWGISPGTLHLGKVSIPLPSLSGYSDTRESADRRAWEWDEVERGATSGAVRESWRERAQEIRARRDRERADTTGVR